RRPAEEDLLQRDERHESEEQCQVGGDGNEEVQARRGLSVAASTNPPGPRTEAERDEEPTVVVTGGDAEKAGVEWDVPVPQALPDGDRVEREIEHDGEDGVGERRKPERDAHAVGNEQ